MRVGPSGNGVRRNWVPWCSAQISSPGRTSLSSSCWEYWLMAHSHLPHWALPFAEKGHIEVIAPLRDSPCEGAEDTPALSAEVSVANCTRISFSPCLLLPSLLPTPVSLWSTHSRISAHRSLSRSLFREPNLSWYPEWSWESGFKLR